MPQARSVLGLLAMGTAFAALATATAYAQAAGDSADLSKPAARAEASYVISPDDDLDIYVLDVPEISRDYRVAPDGTIALPLLPRPVAAAGLTPVALAAAIRASLQEAGMVSHPQVTVQVKESRAHAIAIMGAVKRPQIYPLFGQTTLLAALSQAEGLAQDAGSTAIITRGTAGKAVAGSGLPQPTTLVVNLDRLLEGGDAGLNVALYPGDQVTVQRAGIVYVVGAVNRAGGFVLRSDGQQMTVLKAVALAEGLKSTAMVKKAVIIRKGSASPEPQIPVAMDKILAGREADRPLLANDILFIPDSTGKRALHRAGEAAAEAAALFVYRIP